MTNHPEGRYARNRFQWLLRGILIDLAAVVVAAAAALAAGMIAMAVIQILPHIASIVGDVAAGATGTTTHKSLVSGIGNGIASNVAFFAGLIVGIFVIGTVGPKVMRTTSRYLEDRFALQPPPYSDNAA